MAILKNLNMTLGSLTALAFLFGCQNTQLKACQNLNWRSLGQIAALTGRPLIKSFEQQKTVCKKFKTPVDEVSFNEGFRRGLAEFCTISHGYDYGETGAAYNNTCSSTTELKFLKGFYKGLLVHLEENLTENSKLQAEAEDRLWRKEREYLIVQNENPELAKLEIDIIEAYREEAQLLAKKKRELKKQIVQAKKLSEESYF